MRQTEAPQTETRRRGGFWTVLGLLLLSVTAACCFSLGMWQLGRAEERDALHHAIEQGRRQAPLTLGTHVPASEFMAWRSAQARGSWLDQYTVLLENRNLDGRPGYWVATPLLLEPTPPATTRNDAVAAGSAELDLVGGSSRGGEFLSQGPGATTAAVLVLRGWLPRDMQAMGSLPAIPEEPGIVAVQGKLHEHVPRIFELWQWAGGKATQLPARLPQPGGTPAVVQNLALEDYAAATGLALLPTVLAQTQDTTTLAAPAGDAGNSQSAEGGRPHAPSLSEQALKREWPGPSLDSDQNRGYALQWFSFSAIAAIAALFMLFGLLRRGAQRKKV